VTEPLLSEKVAGFVEGITVERLPDSTIRAVKRLVIDTLGCALGGIGAEPVKFLGALTRDVAPKAPGATCLGDGRRVTTESAIAVNGALVRYLDFMDVYWSRDICHPAENITVALACVEEVNGDGARLIEAVVAGYEAQIRLCDAFCFQDLGFHHASAAGFVAPLVAGKAWGHSSAVMAQAGVLGGFRHMTLGVLSKGDLSMAKAAAYPLSASEGVSAARLASAGFTGPMAAYEWLFDQTGAKIDDYALDHDAYRIERVSLKQFPAQYALQAPVAAAVRLHEKVKHRLDDIRSIRAKVKTETLARAADPKKFKPLNRETADHSLPSCVAMALCDGYLTDAQFSGNRFLDDDVMRLTGLIEAVGDPSFDDRFPMGRPGAVEIEFANGDLIDAVEEIPLGDVDRPMDEAAVQGKFLGQAVSVVGETAARQIIEFIDTLETQSSIVPLLQLCRQI
jgi:2-methylcitrate dehydratase